MARIIERSYPAALGIAAAAIYLRVPAFRDYVWPDTITNLLGAVVTVGGVSVGFLATAKAILIAVDDRPIIKRAREAGVYRSILKYFRAAIRWSFLLTVLSAAALTFDYRGLKVWDWPHAYGTAVWIGVTVTALFAYFRIAQIWYTLLDTLDAAAP